MALFVGKIANTATADDISQMFTKIGPLKRCDFRKTHCFVTFEEEKHAEQAFNELQDADIKGKKINIEWTQESGRMKENRPRENDRAKTEVTCYTCKKTGHISKKCPEAGTARPGPGRSRSRSRSRSPRRPDDRFDRDRYYRDDRPRAYDRERDRYYDDRRREDYYRRDRYIDDYRRDRERDRDRYYDRPRYDRRDLDRRRSRSRSPLPPRGASPPPYRGRSPLPPRERSPLPPRERSPLAPRGADRSPRPKSAPRDRSRDRSPLPRDRSPVRAGSRSPSAGRNGSSAQN